MSKSEKVRAFEAAMKESEELREKYAAAQKRIIENNEAASNGEVLVKAAAEVGFDLSMEELERAMAQAQELSEEELANVSGGFFDPDDDFFCWLSYCCYIAVRRRADDENADRACWLDYQWVSSI